MCFRMTHLISCRKNWDWGEMRGEDPGELIKIEGGDLMEF